MLPGVKATDCVYNIRVITGWHGNGLIVDIAVVAWDTIQDEVTAVYVGDRPL